MNLRLLLTAAATMVLLMGTSHAEIKKESVEYKLKGQTYEGQLVYDDAFSGRRPAVVIIHQWMGITDHEMNSAEKLAQMGYVAFAADIYGKGVRPANTDEAGKFAGSLRGDAQNVKKFREIEKAALDALAKNKIVDSKKIIIMGYCLGGTGALESARAGHKIAGAVSFHGGLSTPNTKDAKKIKVPVLVLHGAVDPLVPQTEVDAFLKEMNDAKVDYQFIAYSDAVHAFTQKGAGNDPKKGFAYNKRADERSWVAFTQFLNEVAPVKK